MCKSSEEEIQRVELKSEFENISIVVNEEKNENIKFENNKWTPLIGVLPKSVYVEEENEDEDDEINEEEQEKMNILKEEIEKKKRKKKKIYYKKLMILRKK